MCGAMYVVMYQQNDPGAVGGDISVIDGTNEGELEVGHT